MNHVQPLNLTAVRDENEKLELDTLKWPESKPLSREDEEPTPPPITELGPIYEPIVRKITGVIQTPAALAMNSVLAAGSLAVQGYANVVNDGRVSPVSLAIVTVGSSGERKSETDRVAMKPHHDKQKYENEGFSAVQASYAADKLSFEKSRDELVNKYKKAGRDALRQKVEELGPAPIPPITPAFLLTDITVEGMYRSFTTGQPSQGLISAEGAMFLNGHSMSDENRLRTAATISLLWDGSPIDRHRSSEGSSVLFGRRLTVHLMVQPAVASSLLEDPAMADQGLLSRILVSAPRSTIGSRPYKEENLLDSEEFLRYQSTMKGIFDSDVVIDKNGGLNPPTIALTADAKRIWIVFHDVIENEMKPGGKYFSIRGLAAKAGEHALRIAANLALIYNQYCSSIGVDFLVSAITLTEYYLQEALRLFGKPEIDPELAKAQVLLDWMRAQNKQVITLTEIYQRGPNHLRDARTARDACDLLIEHGWIQTMQPGIVNGARRKEAFALRPADV